MFRKSSGIALVLLYFALGLVHFLNQSYAKLNNHDLVACVFPRFGLFGYFCYCFFYFEFTFGLNVFAFLRYCFDLVFTTL